MESSRSGNSGSKRTAGGGSISNSNSGNKKRKTTKESKNAKQKTLGMAWGANSRSSSSSSSSSFRSAPFSDFGSYMAEKNRKLQNQFDAEALTSSATRSGGSGSGGKPIFQGVSIFVDGFTVPSSQELRACMLKYGGRFENYFSRHRVTHIICSNLPDSKMKNLRSFSAGLPVVKPAWILDSVVANRLLSWAPYQLDQLANSQPKLSAFFSPRSSLVSKDTLTVLKCQVNLDPSMKGGTIIEANLSEVQEQIDYPLDGIKQPCSESVKSSEERMAEPSNRDVEGGDCVNHELQSEHLLPSASVSSYFIDNQSNRELPTSPVAEASNPRHSTLGDPNFVENYFKSSRLHFIGTWRNRYRKRFASFSSGLKCKNTNLGTSDNSQKTAVIHVDMDCFFVSVVIRNHPELHDKPVAVCHSDNPQGTAEISSANYPARDYGINAGIFVRDAKALCPHLIIVPYNFQAYEEVADQFYKILHKHCNKVQAVSCDEAFLDITVSDGKDPQLLATKIRKEIFETTRCTASAGVSVNMLMARLATRSAKPNGQCYIPPERVDDYLHQLPIQSLPGIGYVLEEKLKKRNVSTCGQLRLISKDSLQKDFGEKTGEMLWNYSRGVDNRMVGVIQESKSVGAEVNWGVRFKDLKDCQHFLLKLCKEVTLRLQGCGVKGRTFTLKVKKRRKDADEPAKYMGCGACENLSHSTTIPVATDDVEVLQRIAKQLFGYFHIDVKDIRGVGLQVSKLENAYSSKQGPERNSLRSWLTSASATTEEERNIRKGSKDAADIDSERQTDGGTSQQLFPEATGFLVQMDHTVPDGEAHLGHGSEVPPLCHLDMGVLENLPPELFSELNEIYGGKLVEFFAKRKSKSKEINDFASLPSNEEGTVGDVVGQIASDLPANTMPVENKAKCCIAEEALPVPDFGPRLHNESSSGLGNSDLMPSSLSQVDTSVLRHLPEELRVDVLGQLPAHRRESTSDAVLGPIVENTQEAFAAKSHENQSTSTRFASEDSLWIGNPPKWVDKFKISSCLLLKSLAEMYYKLGSTGILSVILQRTISECLYLLNESSDDWGEEATNYFCELLKQYIKLKIEFDLEEIYVCFRLLKRFTTRSKFCLQVYNTVLPYLQASASEFYGGHLHIPLE